MDYSRKKFIRIPYLVSGCIYSAALTIFFSLPGLFLIFSQANFQATGTLKVFVFSFFIYVAIFSLLTIIEYGGLRFLGIKERRELRIVNDNIIEGKLRQGLPTETLKEIFYSLSKLPMEAGIKIAVRYGAIIISLLLLTELLASGKTTNLPIVFFGGLVSLILVMSGGIIVGDRVVGPLLKACRASLLERGEKAKEAGFIINLKTRFAFLLLFPTLIILVVLIFIPLDLNIVIFALLCLALAIITNQLLFSSIYQAFSEIINFAKELPKGKKSLFATWSVMKEIVDLTECLNTAAAEIFTTKEKLEEARTILEIKIQARTRELRELAKVLEEQVKERTKELQERVNELEKFHKLTVGRELKMIELKKEIERIKKELKKNQK